jgi:hypothetical protein
MDITEDGVAIDDVILAVKDAIKVAGISRTDEDRDLRVTSVRLVLNTVASAKSGGGVDFRVPVLGMSLKLGGSVTRQDTHSLDITLTPPDVEPRPEVRDADVTTVLVESVNAIRSVLARASGGDDPFGLKTSMVELNFAVTRDGSITMGFNGELHGQLTHTLQISLEAAD